MIRSWFSKRPDRDAPVRALLGRVAEASRQPALYLDHAVPDSFEGRFESLTLHTFLVLRRLRELPAPAGDLAQELVDACFAYVELGLRNGGISDIAVPKRMKKIAQGFYGRVQAYENAVAGAEDGALVAALARNVTGGREAGSLAAYVRSAQLKLSGLTLEDILGDAPLFPDAALQAGAAAP